MWIWLLGALAFAADVQHQLTWDLSVKGQSVGTRTAIIKYVKEGQGMRRVIETTTDVRGEFGPVTARFRQRMTAHANSREPASFHSVTDQNGNPGSVQARWTPGGWFIAVNDGGAERTYQTPISKLDFSTADLLDPDSRYTLDRYEQVKVLSAETGEVIEGTIKRLGSETVSIDGEKVAISGIEWASSQGNAQFWFSSDGYLVRYRVSLAGLPVEGLLADPPPTGVDDFAVPVGRPKIEVTDL